MLWLLLGCHTELDTRPDVVLLLAPGLRQDAESVLVEALQRTPSARFEAAYSQSPDPFVSLGSLLMGDYPSAIPMCGLPVRGVPLTEPPVWCNTPPTSRWSLPEVLASYGYRTAMFTHSFHAGGLLADEFQVVQESDALAEDAAAWWTDGSGPRLLVVVDAGPMMRKTDLWAEQRASARRGAKGLPSMNKNPRATPREAELAVYQTEVTALGQRLGALLDKLPGADLTLIAGLNGINLGEQSGSPSLPPVSMFNDILLERTVHVPLLLLSESASIVEHPELVELVDVLPTVLSVAGAEPAAGLPGRDLRSPQPEPEPHAYSELGDMLSIRKGNYRLSFRGMIHHASALDPELTRALMQPSRWLLLHDIVADPAQAEVVDDGAASAKLLAELRALRQGPAAPPMTSITPEQIEEIQTMQRNGYW